MPDSSASASRELRLKVCTITSCLYANPGLHGPQANTLPAELLPSSEPVYFVVVVVF